MRASRQNSSGEAGSLASSTHLLKRFLVPYTGALVLLVFCQATQALASLSHLASQRGWSVSYAF